MIIRETPHVASGDSTSAELASVLYALCELTLRRPRTLVPVCMIRDVDAVLVSQASRPGTLQAGGGDSHSDVLPSTVGDSTGDADLRRTADKD